MIDPRQVPYISDRTGLTVESISGALLNQFGNVRFKRHTYSFIDTSEETCAVVDKVDQPVEKFGMHLIAFISMVNDETREIVKEADAFHISFFETSFGLLEKRPSAEAATTQQGHHNIDNTQRYDVCMEAVSFSLNHDDGVNDKNLQEADIILMGVSCSDRIPICLYLALQYGICVANYPLIPDDSGSTDLSRMVRPYKGKLSDLTIQPERLQAIRQERRPNSIHAKIDTCRSEVADVQNMFKRHGIPFINTMGRSVEELAVHILQACKLRRRF